MKNILFLGIICLLTFFTSNAQVNLAAGLVAQYTFNGNPNDVSGNNHHAVLKNGTRLGADRYGNQGKAYYFDGIDDYISVSDVSGDFSTSQMSIALWFKSDNDELQNLVGKRNFGATPPSGQQFQFFINYPPAPGIGSNIISSLNGCGDITVMSYTNTEENICAERWYFAVITFDGNLHNIYINGVLKKSVPAGFTSMALCKSELRFGNWWQQDLIPFKGYMDDIRWYNRPLNTEEITELYKDKPDSYSASSNFRFDQVLCNPNTYKFNIIESPYNAHVWDFDDGSPTSSQANPQHTFPGVGNYNIRLISGSGDCVDTVEKIVSVNYIGDGVILPRDTTICIGGEVTLRADSSGGYCWGAGISSREIKVKPTSKTTYTVNVIREGPNLIPNGNFSSGNSGYTSDYFYNSPNSGMGQIFIASNPQLWKAGFCNACADHTTGTGNLLMVDAPLTKDSRVWYRIVSVAKNKTYSFSFWIFTNSSGNRPSLAININNQKIGDYSSVAANINKWTRVTFNWNSESYTSAEISIVSTNPSTSAGNDFGLDDISFNLNTVVKDSVVIDVKEKVALDATPDTAICEGSMLQLKVSGTAQVSWSPAANVSNPNITNPFTIPLVNTTFVVSPVDNASCFSNDTVKVTLKKKPTITVSNDSLLCSGKPGSGGIQLSADGGEVYKWFPSTGLSNTNIATPIASPVSTTTYQVSVTSTNGCTDTGDVKVSVLAFVNVKASADAALCIGKSINFSATGASDYSWAPATGLSATNIANPIATPLVSRSYIVSSPSAGACSGKDTVTITMNALPVVGLTPGDTLLCSGSKIQLKATGGIQYAWSPAPALSNHSIANPLAEPAVKTTYAVEVTDVNGCKSTKEITIDVKATAIVKASADAAICIGKAVNLSATGATDYAWSPAAGLTSANIANPIASPTKTTSYIVSSPSAGACSKNDTVVVTMNALPIVNLTPGDTLLCAGSKVQLNASGGAQYAWSPAAGLSGATIANPFAQPTSKTTYAVEVTDLNSCKQSKNVTIDVKNSVVIKASADGSICNGSSTELQASGASDYLWSPSAGLSNPNSASPLAKPSQTTSYIVNSPSAGVCSGKDTVLITVNPLPTITLTPPESLVCDGGLVQFNASGAVEYNWAPSSGLSNTTIPNPQASPKVTTTYTVNGKGANGCIGTASAKIIVGPGGKVFIPNAFTPNGDGLNDCISIKAAIGAESYEFAIFNRWGERVFYSVNPAECWNGVFKGKVQPNGNFAYYLKMKSACGVTNEKGLITLIK